MHPEIAPANASMAMRVWRLILLIGLEVPGSLSWASEDLSCTIKSINLNTGYEDCDYYQSCENGVRHTAVAVGPINLSFKC